jgi:hypothetical protein
MTPAHGSIVVSRRSRRSVSRSNTSTKSAAMLPNPSTAFAKLAKLTRRPIVPGLSMSGAISVENR